MTPATTTWVGNGANGNWNNPANWSTSSPGGIPANGDDLVFPANAPVNNRLTTNNLANLSVNSITISGSNYTLGGANAVTLTNPGSSNTVVVGVTALNNAIGFDLLLGGVQNNRHFIVVNAGADLNMNGRLLDVSGQPATELVKSGTGLLRLTRDNSTNVVIVNPASTRPGFSGPFTVSQGIVQITHPLALGKATAGTTVQTGAELQLADIDAVVGVDEIIPEPLTLNGSGVTTQGALVNLSGTATLAGGVVLDTNTVIGANAGVLTVTGQISDTGAGRDLTKRGVGEVIFARVGGNTYRGLTTIDNGILTIRDALALGPALGTPLSGTLVNSSLTTGSGTLRLDGGFVGGFTVLNEFLTLNGPGFDLDPTLLVQNIGALDNLRGKNTWAGPVTLGSLVPDGRNVSIGAELDTTLPLGQQMTELTISGVVQDAVNGSIIGAVQGLFGIEITTNAPHNLLGGETVLIEGVQGNTAANGIFTVVVDDATHYELLGSVSNGAYSGGGTWTRLLSMTKVGGGRVILNNRNTYAGPTVVAAGALNVRDSQALGLAGATLGTTVSNGAALELEVDTGFDAFGRNLAFDSIEGTNGNGPQLGMTFSEDVTINGRGLTDPVLNVETGALRSKSGINFWIQDLALAGAQAAIGVDADPSQSSTSAYFTNDYSLTVGLPLDLVGLVPVPVIAGGNATSFRKLSTGHLILSNDNTYTGTTVIEAGWTTVQSNRSLGGDRLVVINTVLTPVGDTVQPETTVLDGAALHLKPKTPGQRFDLLENLVLSGNGIRHNFGLINVKGALMSLGGDNTIGGLINNRSSDIKLIGNAGIGVEATDPEQQDITVARTGPFTLTFFGQTTPLLPAGAGAAEILAALNALPSIGGSGASVTVDDATTVPALDPNVYRVTFGGTLAALNVDLITASPAGNASVTTAREGALSELSITGTLSDFNGTPGGGISKFGSRRLNLQGDGSYTGDVIVEEGVLRVQHNTALGLAGSGTAGGTQTYTTTETTVNAGAALELAASVGLHNGGISAGLNIWNERLVLNSGGNTLFGADVVTVTTNDHLWHGPATLQRDARFQLQPSTRFTLMGDITDAAGAPQTGYDLTLSGGGTLALAGNSSYKGNTLVEQGALQVQNSQALGTGGVAEVQIVTLSGATGGSFSLSFKGQPTGPLPVSATANDVRNALMALPTIANAGGVVTVARSATGALFTIALEGNFLGFDQVPLVAQGSGGTTAQVTTMTDGAGGTQVMNGGALELQGSLTIANEPLIIQGRGVGTTSNVPPNWFQMGPMPINGGQTAAAEAVTGRITGVAADPTDPNVIYIATAGGGAWKTEDGGLNWLPLFDNVLGTAEVQTVTVTAIVPGTGTPGTFALTFRGATTAPLPVNATALQVQAALNSLSTIGGVSGSVSVSKLDGLTNDVYTVTFAGNLANAELPEMTVAAVGDASASVTTTVQGATPPAAPEVQRLDATGAATTYTLTFTGPDATGTPVTLTTAPITANPGNPLQEASAIQTALNALANIGGVGGTVSVTVDAFGGRIFAISFKGALLGDDVSQLAATNGGIVQTIVRGISENNFMFGGAIAVAPTDPRVIYYGTGEAKDSSDSFAGTGVYKSTDSGKTWSLVIDNFPLAGSTGFGTVPSQTPKPSNPLYGLAVTKIVVDPFDPDIIYVSTSDQVLNKPVIASASSLDIYKVPVPGVYRYTPRDTTDPSDPARFGEWFNLTSVTSSGRRDLNGQLPAPPGNPGPEDDFRFAFPQSDATWSDVDIIYADIRLAPGGQIWGVGVAPFFTLQSPVLYAAMGMPEGDRIATAFTRFSNAVFRCENPGVAFGITDTSSLPLGAGSPVFDPLWYLGEHEFARDEIQRVTVSPWQSTSNRFQLQFNGATTPLPGFVADQGPGSDLILAGQIQAALNALSTIGGVGGSVTVVSNNSNTSQHSFLITFGGRLAGSNQPQIVPIFTAPPTVSVSTPQEGGGNDGRTQIPNSTPFPAGANGGGINGTIRVDALFNPNVNRPLSVATVWSALSNRKFPPGVAPTFKEIVRSNSGGRGWPTIATQPAPYMGDQGTYNSALLALSATEVYVGGNENSSATHDNQIFQTANNAASWNNISLAGGGGPHTSQHAIAQDFFDPDGAGPLAPTPRLLFGGDGGLWRFDPTTQTWTNLNGNLAISQFNGIAGHPTNLGIAYGGTRFNGTVRFTDDLAWETVDGDDGGEIHVDPKNPNIVYHVQNLPIQYNPAFPFFEDTLVTALRRSVSGGDAGSWQTVLTVPITRYFPFLIDPINTARLLAGGNGLQESLDFGENWRSLNAPIGVSAVAIASDQGTFLADSAFPQVFDQGRNTNDPNTIYVTDGVTIAVTKNRGTTWVARGVPGMGTISGLTVDPRNRDTVYAVRSSFGASRVFRTTNAGRTWVDISAGLPDMPIWKAVVDARTNDVYLGTEQGVWNLADGATSWVRFGAGLANVQVRDLELNETTNTLLAGTYGRSAYRLFLENGRANGGSLRATSGTSVWTGSVQLLGDPNTNAVSMGADGTQTLQNGVSTAQLIIQGTVTDASGASAPRLLKVGPGDVIFGGNNTYQGVTEVVEGVLGVRSATALGSSAPTAGTIVNAGAALELESNLALEPIELHGHGVQPGFNGHNTGALRSVANNNIFSGILTLAADATIGVDSTSTLTIGTLGNATGTINDGAGTFDLTKELVGTLVFESANSYDGRTIVAQGPLRVSHAQGLGSAVASSPASGTYVLNSGQLQLQTPTTGPLANQPVVVANEALFLSGTGIQGSGALLNTRATNSTEPTNNTWQGPITLTSFSAFAPLVVPPGTVFIGVDRAEDRLTVTGAVGETVPTGTELPNGFVLATPLTLSSGISKVGPGTLVFNQANTFTGGAYVEQGALRVQHSGGLGASNVNEVQRVTVAVVNLPTSGVEFFTLTFRGMTTIPFTFGATAAQVETELNNLLTNPARLNIPGAAATVSREIVDRDGSGNATAYAYTVTFLGSLAGVNQPLMTAVGDNGAVAAVTPVAEGQVGTLVTAGAVLEIDGDPNGVGATISVPETVGVNGAGQGNQGAVNNLSGFNTLNGSVVLQSNASLGAEANSELTVGGFVVDTIPITVASPDLTKVGPGTVVFPNANPYTGLTTVNEGVLNIRNSGALGSPVVSEVQSVALSGLQNGSFRLSYRGPSTITLPFAANQSQIQSALEALPTIGVGNVLVNRPTNSLTFTITFRGALADSEQDQIMGTGFQGTQVTTSTVQDGSQGTIVNAGGTLELQGGIMVSSEPLTINGLGQDNQGALNNASGLNSWDRLITLGSNASVGSESGLLTVNASLVDNGSGFGVTKFGDGTVQYAGTSANVYTGVTNVFGGTLSLNKPAGVDALRGSLVIGDGVAPTTATVLALANDQLPNATAVTVNNNGKYDLNLRSETIGPLTISAEGASPTQVHVNTGIGVGTGALTVSSLNMTGGIIALDTSTSTLTLNGNVTATSSSSAQALIRGVGRLVLNNASRVFNVADGPGAVDLEIESQIGNAGAGLQKTGAGTMAIDAFFAGASRVTGGTLQADGTIGNVLLDGGTVSGNGTVGVVSSNSNGGGINPGDFIGTLNSGGVTLNATNNFFVNLASGSSPPEQLVVTGNISLNGATLNGMVNPSVLPGQSFTILRASGDIFGQFAAPLAPFVFIDGKKFSIQYNLGAGEDSVVLTRQQNIILSIQLTASISAPAYGQRVTFTAVPQMEPGAGPLPDGETIFFTLDGTPFAVTTVGGQAVFDPSELGFLGGPLSLGAHTLTATFNGNGDTSARTSNELDITVSPASTNTILSKTPTANAVVGQTVTVFADIEPVLASIVNPTGSVVFTLADSNNNVILTTSRPINGSGVAAFDLPSLALGSYRVSAAYAGDGNFLASQSVSPITVTFTKAATDVDLQFNPTAPVVGQAVTLLATVSVEAPGSGIPTGTVTFREGNLVLGSAAVNAQTGLASLQISTLSVGTHTIVASYNGDGNFDISGSAPMDLTVSAGNSTIQVTSSQPTVGQPVNVTATVLPVAPASGVPTGVVTFQYDGGAVVPRNLVNGSASFSTPNLTAGSHTLVITYNGDSRFTTSTTTITIGGATVTTLTTVGSGVTVYGETAQFEAQVTPTSGNGGVPTGSVQFFIDGDPFSSPVPLDNTGKAVLRVNTLSASAVAHTVTATYTSNGAYSGSSSGTIQHTVNMADTALALSSSVPSALVGQAVTITARLTGVAPSTLNPSDGTVTFIIDGNFGNPLTGQVGSNGTASIQLPSLAEGSHTVSAFYNGSSNFNGSGQVTIVQNVGRASTTTLTASPSKSFFGQTLTFVATVGQGTPGGPTPTGTVQFIIDGNTTNPPTVNVDGNGQAILNLNTLSVGNHSVIAVYSGDGTYATSRSLTVVRTVNLAKTVIKVGATPLEVPQDRPITFNVTIKNKSTSAIPTGVVQFFLDDVLVSTQTLDTTGKTSLTLSNLTRGGHKVRVNYLPSGNFADALDVVRAFRVIRSGRRN